MKIEKIAKEKVLEASSWSRLTRTTFTFTIFYPHDAKKLRQMTFFIAILSKNGGVSLTSGQIRPGSGELNRCMASDPESRHQDEFNTKNRMNVLFSVFE